MKLMVLTESTPSVVLAGDLVSATVPLDDIRWEREFAVVVDMGERRTGGYGVTVTAVRPGGPGEVAVDLQVRRPGAGSFVTQVLTHPYAVARVPRAGLPAGSITIVARDQNGTELARQAVAL